MELLIGLEFTELNTRPRQSLTANEAACTGCRSCETTCSLIKTGRIEPRLARLRVERDPFEVVFRPLVCHQCSNPQCLKACPAGAIGVSPKTGAVLVDPRKCDGCGDCARACPFGMIVLDAESGQALKCNLCGGNPNCVQACPNHALGLSFFGPRRER